MATVAAGALLRLVNADEVWTKVRGVFNVWTLLHLTEKQSCRKDLVAEIEVFVNNHKERDEQYFVVVGEKGVGKTAAIAKALSTAGNPTVTTIIKDGMDVNAVVPEILTSLTGTSDVPTIKRILAWHKYLGGSTPVVLLTNVGTIGPPLPGSASLLALLEPAPVWWSWCCLRFSMPTPLYL